MLVQGSFRVSTQALDKKISAPSTTSNPTPVLARHSHATERHQSCPFGNRSVRGITGSFTVTFLYAAILSKITSGKTRVSATNQIMRSRLARHNHHRLGTVSY